MRSFVGGQLRRFETHAQFPVLEFLALLFKYTFLQTRTESFYACLEAWNTCMDYIATALGNRRTEGLRILERCLDIVLDCSRICCWLDEHESRKKHIFIRYHQALLSLVTELLSRIQLQSGKHRLGDLDDTTLDDDDETEWKQFLRISIETVMKAAELIPDDVLRILVRFL